MGLQQNFSPYQQAIFNNKCQDFDPSKIPKNETVNPDGGNKTIPDDPNKNKDINDTTGGD